MPTRCEGFSRRLGADSLEQCSYDANGSRFCYFHGKVAEGLLVGSWTPKKDKAGEVLHDPFEKLLVEWNL